MTGKRKTRINSGLHVVKKILAGGEVRWYVYAYRGGPCIHSAAGPRPVITDEILSKAAEPRLDRRKESVNNINSLIAEYQESPEWARLGDRTKHDYRRDLGKISAKFGNAPLAVFSDMRMRADVMKWRASMASTPRTADRAIVMLATLLSWGVTQARLTRNICAGIPLLYQSNRSEMIWSDADWQAIAPHCSKELLQGLRLGALTGLRLGDLVRVSWEHVGLQSLVYVTRKRNRRVVIPLLPELRALLDEIGRGKGPILRNSFGAPWTESGFGGVFQKAKKKAAGFDIELRIHDLRGTYATWLARKGLTDQEIGRIVAWSEKQVAEIRRRYIDEEHVVSSLVERLSNQTGAA